MKWSKFSPLLFLFYNSTSPFKAVSIECKERNPSPYLYIKACAYDLDGDGRSEEFRSHVERDDNHDGLVDYIEDCKQYPGLSVKYCMVGYGVVEEVKLAEHVYEL